jgi:hypothetical protein
VCANVLEPVRTYANRACRSIHAILDVPARREPIACTPELVEIRLARARPRLCGYNLNACHNVWEASSARSTSFTAYASSTRIAARGPDPNSKRTGTQRHCSQLSFKGVHHATSCIVSLLPICELLFAHSSQQYETMTNLPVYPRLTAYTSKTQASQIEHSITLMW